MAELTPEILQQLNAKHPRKPRNPFGHAEGLTPGQAPEVNVILKALDASSPTQRLVSAVGRYRSSS